MICPKCKSTVIIDAPVGDVSGNRCVACFYWWSDAEQNAFQKLQEEIGEWGAKMFPIKESHLPKDVQRCKSVLHHMIDEVQEAQASMHRWDPNGDKVSLTMLLPDPEEIADIGILLLQLAHTAGIDLYAEINAKMRKNYKRKWQAPDERGVVRHAE